MCVEFSVAAVVEIGCMAAKATDFVLGLVNLTQDCDFLDQVLVLLVLDAPPPRLRPHS